MDQLTIIRIGLAAVTFGVIAGIMLGQLTGKWLWLGFLSAFGLIATCLI